MLQLHKPHFIFSLCLVLLLSMVPAAYAAPPLQSDGSTLGDSLNLNEDGTPVDEGDDTSGGNNLGTVMSGKDDEATEEDPSAEETPEAEPTPEGDTGEVDAKQHPVAVALSEYFEVEYDEIMNLHEDGYGFGNIAKAYFFANQLADEELTPEDLISDARGKGWGNVLKEKGIHPGSVGNGGGNKDVPGQENGAKGPQNSDAPDLTGQSGHGGGNGNGGGNGHGGGNGNGGGNGHGGGNGNGGGNGHGNGRGNN